MLHYTETYPIPTRGMSTEDLLAESTRLERLYAPEFGAPFNWPFGHDRTRYSFVRRELQDRGVI